MHLCNTSEKKSIIIAWGASGRAESAELEVDHLNRGLCSVDAMIADLVGLFQPNLQLN